MKYLITGATGFLGRHLLQALHDHAPEAQAVVLVRRRSDWAKCDWAEDAANVQVLEGELTHPEAWENSPLLAELQGIFHLAALVRHNRRDTDEVFRVNIDGTGAMVRLAARLGCRMVFVSTSGTVGCFRNSAAQPDEEAPYCEDEVRGWPYYASKIRAEQHAQRLAEELGASLVIVRPPMMLGPGDHRFRATGQVVRFLRRRLPFLIHGGIHFVDIRDAARALIAAMQLDAPRPVYHLRGTACSIDRFFSDLGAISGLPTPRFHLPFPVAWSLAKADEWIGMRVKGHPLALFPDPVVIEMATRYWDVSSLYAREDLGFEPRDGYQTLTDTVSWLRENHSEL